MQRSTISRTRAWWVRDVVYVALLGLSSFLVASLGFFNYGDETDYASRDIFYRAWGVGYPTERSPRSTVVLFSDASLGPTGFWPTPYETHAAFFRALLPLQPAAVMVDIGFFDERPDETIANLIEALKAYSQQGVPVFFAAASGEAGANRPIRRELWSLAETGAIQLVSIDTGRQKGRLNMYPTTKTAEGYQPAAAAIYQALCDRQTDLRCAPLEGKHDFEVWWAAKPHEINCNQLTLEQGSCADISASAPYRLLRLALNWFAGDYEAIAVKELDPIPAPYTATTQWEKVVGGQLSKAERDAVHSSVVFYGLDLALINDQVYSPVHGQGDQRSLPGVYYHAMAYDNLVALGASRIDPEPPFGLSSSQHMAVLVMVCALLCLMSRILLGALGLHSFSPYADWIVFFVTATAIAVFEFRVLNVSPANWLGILLSLIPFKLADAAGWTDRLFRWLGLENNNEDEMLFAGNR